MPRAPTAVRMATGMGNCSIHATNSLRRASRHAVRSAAPSRIERLSASSNSGTAQATPEIQPSAPALRASVNTASLPEISAKSACSRAAASCTMLSQLPDESLMPAKRFSARSSTAVAGATSGANSERVEKQWRARTQLASSTQIELANIVLAVAEIIRRRQEHGGGARCGRIPCQGNCAIEGGMAGSGDHRQAAALDRERNQARSLARIEVRKLPGRAEQHDTVNSARDQKIDQLERRRQIDFRPFAPRSYRRGIDTGNSRHRTPSIHRLERGRSSLRGY